MKQTAILFPSPLPPDAIVLIMFIEKSNFWLALITRNYNSDVEAAPQMYFCFYRMLVMWKIT
jgi:G:T-mismatch repair DNA endonuclease (very short patch repair protein)